MALSFVGFPGGAMTQKVYVSICDSAKGFCIMLFTLIRCDLGYIMITEQKLVLSIVQTWP